MTEAPQHDEVVTARALCKSYGGQRVVNELDLSVQRGECFGLLGPNGAGKTTTLSMLLGMTMPDSGNLQVLDHPIPAQAREARHRIGVVPQTDNLDPDFTVTENLCVYAQYYGLRQQDFEGRLQALLQFANLEAKAEARIDALSGGMKRRLALARALVNEPELVVLDEPTTGLDPQARQVIWQRMRELINQGTTLVLTTHYMDEAQRLCDRLAIMDQGRILDIGTPSDLIHRHIEPHVIEVHGEGTESWFEQQGRGLCERSEKVGETLFCYTRLERELVDSLCEADAVQYLSRPGNLEDVFLKLTGRDLRE